MQWRADKAAGVWGENPSIPMYIEDDGTVFTQSTAILEYLAVLHGVVPANAKENFEKTWYWETEHDWKSKKGWGTAMMQDECTVEEMMTTIDIKKGFMDALDAHFADGREHVAGASVTSADFALLTFYVANVTNQAMRHALVGE